MANSLPIYENRDMPDTPGETIERHDIARFACVSCLVFVMTAMFNPPSRASILMWFSSRKVDGVVRHEADPNNHNYLSYEYTVDGKTHSGVGYGPRHADMKEGQGVTVHFFPVVPSESVLVDKDEQRGYAAFGLGAGLLMGIFAGFGDHWNRKRIVRQRHLQMTR